MGCMEFVYSFVYYQSVNLPFPFCQLSITHKSERLMNTGFQKPRDKGGGERSERGICRKPLQTLLIPRSPFVKGANATKDMVMDSFIKGANESSGFASFLTKEHNPN